MGSTVNGKPVNMQKSKQIPGTVTLKATESGILVEETPRIIIDDSSMLAEIERTKKHALSEREKVDDYNNSLYELRNPLIDKVELTGNRILVRLYRLQFYTKDGMYIGGRKQTVMSRSELDKKIVDAPNEAQFQERGVVVKISPFCSPEFKQLVKEGDVVDIDPGSFTGKAQRWMEKELVNSEFDNYFIFSEYSVEMVHKKN